MSLYSWSRDKQGAVLARLGRLEDALPYQTSANVYAAKQAVAAFTSLADSTANATGLIDLSSPGIVTVGSVPPQANTNGFAATSSSGGGAGTSNIHIYWDGTNGSSVIVLHRADTTSAVVPGGDINVTGLDPSTTYYFLPFWTPQNACVIGWVPGTVGTPAIAFSVNTDVGALAQQLYQHREQLTTGYMSFVTAAAGGSSSPGPGGGGDPTKGGCVMLGTDIEPMGDSFYRNVHRPNDHWWRVVMQSGRSLNGTLNHPIYHAERGKVELGSIKTGDWLISDTGEDKVLESHPFNRLCTKVETLMDKGHLYFANGLLSHNQKPSLE